jgi:hypothetical protein
VVLACLYALKAHGTRAQDANDAVPVTNGGQASVAEPEKTAACAPADSLSERFYDFRLADDLRSLPRDLGCDLRSLFSISNAVSLGISGGLAAVAANNWDDDVRENTARHARRFGGFNNVMDVVGHPASHLGAGATLYAASLLRDEPQLHDASMSLLHALVLTDASVVGLKLAFDTTRPNGKSHGFPSGHVASSFAVAAVLEEYAGPNWGMAGFTAAGLVAWHRIDDRKHDLSDVLFGAALGYAMGETVSKSHRLRAAGIEVAPYSDAETTAGVLLHRRY